VLLQVELDSPSPEEPPRVTVRGAQPLAEVKSAARMVLTLDIDLPGAFIELAALLAPGLSGAGGKGEVLARLKTGTPGHGIPGHGSGREPLLRLGRDFALDGELAERIAAIEGVHNVSLSARRGAPNLRLVA
jgi:DNA polymerase-3 subunit alpha